MTAFASLKVDIQAFIHVQMQLQDQQHERTRQTVQEGATKISNQLQSMHISTQDQKARDKLLDSLFFPDMNARKNQITPAHLDTFEWLLKRDTTDLNSDAPGDEIQILGGRNSGTWDISTVRRGFHRWLTHDQRVYWINGKPGSGKSTLMSFIAEHKSTREYLQEWSRLHQLVLIEGYLWNAGNENQKSYRGLLATLLTQLFRHLPPVLDSILLNDLNLSQKLTLMDWSVRELEKWLLHCLQSDDVHFCIFIDGLDEAEVDTTSHTNKILHFVESAAALTNVKVCVSSRTLPEFEIAFENCPCLRLQHLNTADIRKYFSDNAAPLLESFGINAQRDNLENLTHIFCRKADGVFLWACLAVRILKECVVSDGDDYHVLRQRLEALPPELEDIYRHMWKRQNKPVRLFEEEASLFFNICLMDLPSVVDVPLTLLHMVFVRPSNRHLTYEALTGQISDDLEQACSRIQAQIKSRCVGLLEVVESSPTRETMQSFNHLCRYPALQRIHHTRVVFVHRTARDFLLTSALGRSICSKTEHTVFQLRRLVCKAKLCATMVIDPTPTPLHLYQLINSTLKLRRLPKKKERVLLNDMENVFKNRVLATQQHVTENTWSACSSMVCNIPGQAAVCDFLGAELLAGWPWSLRDKLDHCIQGHNPSYQLYLMCCCLSGMQRLSCDLYEQREYLLRVLWNVKYWSEELLQQVVYLRCLDVWSNEIGCSTRICATNILFRSFEQLRYLDDIVQPRIASVLSFFDNMLILPFVKDQKILVTETAGTSTRLGVTLPWGQSFLAQILAEDHVIYHDRIAVLQVTFGFLLRAGLHYAKTKYGIDFPHRFQEQSSLISSSDIKVVSVIGPREQNNRIVKVNIAESNALLSLLGYDGPSGHEKFLNCSDNDSEGPRESLFAKIDDVLDHGESVDGLAYFKELGFFKDNDDPEVGQWPPPFRWNERSGGGSSERQCQGNSYAARDNRDTSISQDPNTIRVWSLEDDSDEDEFFDAPEEHA